jgi:hypothetical protein
MSYFRILILLLLAAPSLSFSQSPDWLWVRQIKSLDEPSPYATTFIKNNNIYVSASTFDTSTGPYLSYGHAARSNTTIAKYSYDHQKIWETEIVRNYKGGRWASTGPGNLVADKNENVYAILYHRDTIKIGQTIIPDSNSYQNTPQLSTTLIKLNANGQLEWFIPLRQTKNIDFDALISDICLDSNDNVIITGKYHADAILGDKHLRNGQNGFDVFVAKIDSVGQIQWAYTFDSVEYAEGESVSADRFGNIYVGGMFRVAIPNTEGSTLSHGEYDYFIMKLTSSGALQWSRSIGSGATEYSEISVCTDYEGSTFFAGELSDTAMISSSSQVSIGGVGPGILKFSTDGTPIRIDRSFSEQANSGAFNIYDMSLDEQENLLVCGSYLSPTTYQGISILSVGKIDGFVSRFSRSGSFHWFKTAGSKELDEIVHLSPGTNSSVFVSGFCSDTITKTFAMDRTDKGYFGSHVLVVDSISHAMFISKVGIRELKVTGRGDEAIGNVYPNPAKDKIHIALELSEPQRLTFTIIDILGKSVYELEPQLYQTGKQTVELPIDPIRVSGIYFLRITTDKGEQTIQRIAVE